jgi:hypothetical protein
MEAADDAVPNAMHWRDRPVPVVDEPDELMKLLLKAYLAKTERKERSLCQRRRRNASPAFRIGEISPRLKAPSLSP